MKEFITALPQAASSPYAFAAYAIAGILFLFAGARLRLASILTKRLELVPPEERRRVLEIATGTILPKSISPEQWIRLKKSQWWFTILAALIITVLALVTIALLSPKGELHEIAREQKKAGEAIHSIAEGQTAVLDAVTYRLLPATEYQADVRIVLSKSSDYYGSLLQDLEQQVLKQLDLFDPANDFLQNGWRVERRITNEAPPTAALVFVPAAAYQGAAVANVRLWFYIVRDDSGSTGPMDLVASTGDGPVRLTLKDGKQDLIYNARNKTFELEIARMTVATDDVVRNDFKFLRDLGANTLVLGLVPYADNDVDYEKNLYLVPFTDLKSISIRMVEHWTLTLNKTQLQAVEHGQPLLPLMVKFAFPSDIKALTALYTH